MAKKNGGTVVEGEKDWVVQLEKMVDHHDPSKGYTYEDYSGKTDEAMARSIGESLKRIGCGGRVVFLDGSKDGLVKEQWASLARLALAKEEVDKK